MGAWAASTAPRRGHGATAWLVAGCGLSLGVGAAAASGATWLLLSLSFTVALALAILRWPFPAMVVLLAVRTSLKSPFLDLAALAGGGLALALAAPRLPGHRVWVPLAALLLLTLPSLPLHPSLDEGVKPAWLTLPKTSVHYLPQPSAELLGWLRLGSVLVAFMLATWTVRDARRLRVLVGATLVSAVVPVGIALKQLAGGQLVVRAGFKAIEGPFTHPNYFAFYLVVVLTLGLVALVESRGLWLRLALGGLLACCLVCLLETYTRSAWIGFAGVLALLGLLRYRWLFGAGAVALVVAAFAFPASVHKVEQRFGDLSSQSASRASNSWTWRTSQWRRMLPYGYARPLSGQGYGSYSRLTLREFGSEDPEHPTIADRRHPAQSQQGFAAHNDYVRMMVETGVPGLVLYTLFLGGLVTTSLRARKHEGVGPYACAAAAIGAALVVMSAADNIEGYTVVLVYGATLVGGVAGAMRGEHLVSGREARGAVRAAPPVPA
jgi:putative inorganic carbon (hco3(-)) transporter